MDQRKRAPSGRSEPPEAGGGETFVEAPAPTVPVEVLDTVFEFLDGNGLLSCEAVSYCWRRATDRTHLWQRACMCAFPHLRDYYFSRSPYTCCSAYEGDYRETFLDGNRGNRSTVLDWNMEAVTGGAADGADGMEGGDPEQASEGWAVSERRYFPPFSLCGYLFMLLADPTGNPRAASQAQAAGAPPAEKGLSVYLTVAFHDDPPDTPPWGVGGGGGGGGASFEGFPPPPQHLLVGQPWGAEEEGGVRAETNSDPHGLRRRRRRARTREGRAAIVSHAGEPAAIARECCAAFSLAAVNTEGDKGVVWVSSMEGDRFWHGRRSWGVHCLIPMGKVQDPEQGFVKDGRLTVRLRARLLFLFLHVYTTADLASHRGFGVVPVRGRDRRFHFYGNDGVEQEEGQETSRNHPRDPPPAAATCSDGRSSPGEKNRNTSTPAKGGGPLPCITFEVLRCSTLEEVEGLIARTLGVEREGIRLWVISQPFTDGPLAPRQLLSGKGLPARFLDDGQNSPSLFRLLSGDAVDETCRVRLWVEQRGDGGFWEKEGGRDVTHLSRVWPQQRQTDKMGAPVEPSSDGRRFSDDGGSGAGDADGSRLSPSPSTQPDPKDNYAGVRLTCTADVYPFHQQSTLAWESASDESAPPTAGSPVSEGDDAGDEDGAAADGASGNGQRMPPEERILVFVKTLGLGTEESQSVAGTWRGGDANHCGGGAAAAPPPPPTAAELDTALAPEDLEAYVEDLPWVWQSAVVATDPEIHNAETAEPSGGRTAAVRHGASQNERFFACPPPPTSPGGPHPSPGGGVAAMAAAAAAAAAAVLAVAGQREQGDGDVGVTLERAGLSSGASICFFRAGDRSAVRRTYNAAVESLVEEMNMLLRGEGPLGRVHLIKLAEVVEICESLGYQGFRPRIAHDQQRHVNPRETLEYIAQGRQLAFICDSCGTQDFTGPRYHCLACPDYDLCQRCNAKKEPAPRHRYLFANGQWKREAGFQGHTDDHELEEIFTVPAECCNWQRTSWSSD
ncbi:unnamed protein product [Ectocarpus sp. CCAP 1310/34]|nr:unnamed protein product [Ectocarpus sp. CCAP 1310/34]